jgi:DNA-binding NarL/FixJ family response regulator
MRPRRTVILIHPNSDFLSSMKYVIETRGHYYVVTEQSAELAFKILEGIRCATVMIDVASEDKHSFSRRLKYTDPDAKVIVFSDCGEAPFKDSLHDAYIGKFKESIDYLLSKLRDLSRMKPGPRRITF